MKHTNYKLKNVLIDQLTGKILNSHNRVIECKNAVDWCKKQGYEVIENRNINSDIPILNALANIGNAVIVKPIAEVMRDE